MKAHKCPVCNGNGIAPNGFYNQTSGDWSTTDATPEKCRTCDGTGVVWEPEESIQISKIQTY